MIIDSTEVGIPELMKLYYDVYDEKQGDYVSMSPEMLNIYQADVDTFYKTFTGKAIETDENGNKKITKFDQIPLKEYHKSEGCKADGIYTKAYEGSLNVEFGKENLFQKYATHVKKMMNNMNANQDNLLGILKQLLIFQSPNINKKKEEEKKKKEDEEEKKRKEKEDKEEKDKEEKEKKEEKIESTGKNESSDKSEMAAPDIIQGMGQGQGVAAAGPAAPVANVNAPAPPNAPEPVPANALPPANKAPEPAPDAPVPAPVPDAAPSPKPSKPTVLDKKTNITAPEPDIQVGGEPAVINAPAVNAVKEKTTDEIDDVVINPDLDEKLLNSLINSARKLIVNLYITCEEDFVEGIHIFEAIVAVQLARTTNSQLSILNEISLEYLAEHQSQV